MADDKPISGPAAPPTQVQRQTKEGVPVTSSGQDSIRERARRAGFIAPAGTIFKDEIAPGVPRPPEQPTAVIYEVQGRPGYTMTARAGADVERPAPRRETTAPPPPPSREEFELMVRQIATPFPLQGAFRTVRYQTWADYINDPEQVVKNDTLQAKQRRREQAIHQAEIAIGMEMDPLDLRAIFPDDVIAAAEARSARRERERWGTDAADRIAAIVRSIRVYAPGPVESRIVAYLRATGEPLTEDYANLINAERDANAAGGDPEEVAEAERISKVIDLWTEPYVEGGPSLRDLMIFEARQAYTRESYGALEQLYRDKEHAWHWVLIGDELVGVVLLAPLIASISAGLVAAGIPAGAAHFLANFVFWQSVSVAAAMRERATREKPPLPGEATAKWARVVALLETLVNLTFSIPGHWSIGVIGMVLGAVLEPEQPGPEEKQPKKGPVPLTWGQLAAIAEVVDVWHNGRKSRFIPWSITRGTDGRFFLRGLGAHRPEEPSPYTMAEDGSLIWIGQ